MDKILVLMSTYNGEKYIEEQIKSIENQRFHGYISILIRDDGSTDNTRNIIKDMQSKYKNINLIEGDNIGCNASFFELIKNAPEYDFYALSDQDDYWLENKIEKALNKLPRTEEKPCLFGSSSFIVDDKLNIKGKTQINKRGITFYNVIIQNIIPGHSQVFNNKLKEKIIEKWDNNRICVYDYWISMIAASFGNIYFENEALTYYRQHTTNEIGYGKSKIQWVQERFYRIKKHYVNRMFQQINFFYESYSTQLSEDQKSELKLFITSNDKVIKRIIYALNSKFFRQNKIETLLYRMMYAIGMYC